MTKASSKIIATFFKPVKNGSARTGTFRKFKEFAKSSTKYKETVLVAILDLDTNNKN